MHDYPDISQYPDIVYLSISEIHTEVENLINCGIKSLIELQYIVEEVIRTISINSNYHDNLVDLLDVYASNIISAKDRISFEVYKDFIISLANLIAYKLKDLGLYALDDIAYYKVLKCHTPTLFTLLKVNPVQFNNILEDGYSVFGFPQ